MEGKQAHWNSIYNTKDSAQLSWTQNRPSPSLEWILDAFPERNAAIIDVGGGISPLAEFLINAGYVEPTVLDISGSAIKKMKEHLGDRQNLIEWVEGDVTIFKPIRRFDLWHDRAVFHFLTNRTDREKYLQNLRNSLSPKGKILLATFSPNGPGQCSGLNVMRFDEKALAYEIGSDFKLIRSERHAHQTPWGNIQEFQYCLFETSA